MTPLTAAFLKPGDVLLYKPSGAYGWIIRLKTWHPISHVEVYHGAGVSAASRDGIGVGFYPVRLTDVAAVMRPRRCFNVAKADAFVRSMLGTPYGWFDLLQFVGLNVNRNGIVCSPFATLDLRAGGISVFNDEDANKVAPFQFLDSELLEKVWSA